MSESIIRSGFDLPVLAALPQDLQDRLAQVQEKSGFSFSCRDLTTRNRVVLLR